MHVQWYMVLITHRPARDFSFRPQHENHLSWRYCHITQWQRGIVFNTCPRWVGAVINKSGQTLPNIKTWKWLAKLFISHVYSSISSPKWCRICVVVVQGGPRQQRGDHSLFPAGQRHLLQTGPWLCPQFPGDHLHETHLLRQLLRICESPPKLEDGVWWNIESALWLGHILQLLQLYVAFSFALACWYSRWCFSPCSSPQLWGVIKQGYRCKGNYCTPSCTTLTCPYIWPNVSLCHA